EVANDRKHKESHHPRTICRYRRFCSSLFHRGIRSKQTHQAERQDYRDEVVQPSWLDLCRRDRPRRQGYELGSRNRRRQLSVSSWLAEGRLADGHGCPFRRLASEKRHADRKRKQHYFQG